MHIAKDTVLLFFAHLVLFALFMEVITVDEQCYCGYKEDSGEEIRNKNKGDAKYPWMVALDSIGRCTGALISPTAVLTAAHCDYTDEVHIIGKSGKSSRSLKVRNVTRHPAFLGDSKFFMNDIAIWHLETAIKCKEDSIPICIPEEEFEGELEIIIAGFGPSQKNEQRDHLGRQFSDFETRKRDKWDKDDVRELKEGTVKLVNSSNCLKEGRRDVPKESFYCSQGTKNTSTCTDDSGGPLFYEKNKVFYSLGVTSGSMTAGCPSKTLNLLSNVFYHRNFIKKNVKDLPKPRDKEEPHSSTASSTSEGSRIDFLLRQLGFKKHYDSIKKFLEETNGVIQQLTKVNEFEGTDGWKKLKHLKVLPEIGNSPKIEDSAKIRTRRAPEPEDDEAIDEPEPEDYDPLHTTPSIEPEYDSSEPEPEYDSPSPEPEYDSPSPEPEEYSAVEMRQGEPEDYDSHSPEPEYDSPSPEPEYDWTSNGPVYDTGSPEEEYEPPSDSGGIP